MKKDEHARKRKELTKRKIQEEKTAALNRLVCAGTKIYRYYVLTNSSSNRRRQRLEELLLSQKL
jgi:PAPA-1-like conserved region